MVECGGEMVELKITVSTENEFPPIISLIYNQCALKVNWCTLINMPIVADGN